MVAKSTTGIAAIMEPILGTKLSKKATMPQSTGKSMPIILNTIIIGIAVVVSHPKLVTLLLKKKESNKDELDEVHKYIADAKHEGLSDVEIKKNLLESGWDGNVVDEVMKKKHTHKQHTEKKHTEKKHTKNHTDKK